MKKKEIGSPKKEALVSSQNNVFSNPNYGQNPKTACTNGDVFGWIYWRTLPKHVTCRCCCSTAWFNTSFHWLVR